MKELLPTTGYIRGGCTPIGMKKPFPTFIDESCLEFDYIYQCRTARFAVAPLAHRPHSLQSCKNRKINSLTHTKRLFTALFLLVAVTAYGSEERMNHNWLFRIATDATADYSAESLDCSDWQEVRLPHTPRYEKYYPGEQWQGICWYRHTIEVDKVHGEQWWLNIEGAMNVADVWVNGMHCTHHLGGYLPVAVDLTNHLHKGKNTIALRLDNNDNPITGPRPIKRLDFLWYGGLYRNVSLIRKGGHFVKFL